MLFIDYSFMTVQIQFTEISWMTPINSTEKLVSVLFKADNLLRNFYTSYIYNWFHITGLLSISCYITYCRYKLACYSMTQSCQNNNLNMSNFWIQTLEGLKKTSCQQIHVKREKPKVTVTENIKHENKSCCYT